MTISAHTKIFATLIAFAAALSTAAQSPRAEHPKPPVPPVASSTDYKGTYERSIATDPNVSLSLCVQSGQLSVNSWNHDEIRVFVNGGAKFGFTVKQKTAAGKPAWIEVSGLTSVAGRPSSTGCLSAEIIEIDAPKGTSFSLKGGSVNVSVDSLKKVTLFTAGGSTQLRNISGGLDATVGQGNISVEDSAGMISVKTTTGNILVYEASPSQTGDTFYAKTSSGNISLQRIDHRQLDVNSISGSITYNGAILDGGAYNFATQNGKLIMSLPTETACRFAAIYGGSLSMGLPFELVTENIQEGPIKSIVGKIGNGGDATLKLTSPTGSILLRKQ